MVLGLLMQTRVGAVARSPRGCTVRWAQGALFFLTAPMNTNSFWFPGSEVQTPQLASANVHLGICLLERLKMVETFLKKVAVWVTWFLCDSQKKPPVPAAGMSTCFCLFVERISFVRFIFIHVIRRKRGQIQPDKYQHFFLPWMSNLDLQRVGMLARTSSIYSGIRRKLLFAAFPHLQGKAVWISSWEETVDWQSGTEGTVVLTRTLLVAGGAGVLTVRTAEVKFWVLRFTVWAGTTSSITRAPFASGEKNTAAECTKPGIIKMSACGRQWTTCGVNSRGKARSLWSLNI